MKFKFFKSGTHTDKDGNTKTYSENDLDKIVSNYNSRIDDAPIVLGHPIDNSPAIGWIEKIERAGDWLYANVKDLSSDITKSIEEKAYKYLSPRIRDDLSVRHIGLVPVAAIKGTEILFEYSESEKYSDFTTNFEFEISKGIENMDFEKMYNNSKLEIDELKKKISDYEKEKHDFSETDKIMKTQQQQIEMLQKNIKDMQNAAKDKNISDFCEGLCRDGKLTPADLQIEKDTLLTIAKLSDYSEGENSILKKRMDFLNAKKPVIDNASIKYPNSDFSEDEKGIDAMAQKIVKEKGISYTEALKSIYLERK